MGEETWNTLKADDWDKKRYQTYSESKNIMLLDVIQNFKTEKGLKEHLIKPLYFTDEETSLWLAQSLMVSFSALSFSEVYIQAEQRPCQRFSFDKLVS